MTIKTLDETVVQVSGLEIHKCTVVSAGPTFMDFKFTMLELNYFEDLFSNVVSGTLIINDSNGFHNKLSWCGDEYLLLEFNKPDTRDDKQKFPPFKGIFRIFSTESRHLTGREYNENFVLHFCSEESFLSSRMKISKSYKNMRISDIVIDIAVNILKIPKNKLGYDPRSKTYANIEETFDKRDIVIPNMQPLEAINWLSTMAISDPANKFGNHGGLEGGATFFFYNNRYGWYFRSLLSIFNTVNQSRYRSPMLLSGSDEGYWYGVKNAEYPKGMALHVDPHNQILSYQIQDTFDAVQKNLRSIMSNKLIAIDYLRRTHEEKIFDYEKYFNNHLSKKVELYKEYNTKPILSNAEDRFKKTHNDYQTVWKIAPSTTNQKNNPYIKKRQPNISANYVENTIPYRFAQIGLMNYNNLKLLIPGDPYISTGRLIYVYLPQPTQTETAKKPQDRFLKGWYLVSCVRQKIDQTNFQTVLECVKDSYNSDVDVYDTKNIAPGLAVFDNSNTMIMQIRAGTFDWEIE
jgi:hypothetical protein